MTKIKNYAIENHLQDFKPNFTLLNEIIDATVSVINPGTIRHKQRTIEVKETPTIEEMKTFWSNIWNHEKSHNKKKQNGLKI